MPLKKTLSFLGVTNYITSAQALSSDWSTPEDTIFSGGIGVGADCRFVHHFQPSGLPTFEPANLLTILRFPTPSGSKSHMFSRAEDRGGETMNSIVSPEAPLQWPL
jgi:hypothetical protein